MLEIFCVRVVYLCVHIRAQMCVRVRTEAKSYKVSSLAALRPVFWGGSSLDRYYQVAS